MKKTIFILPGSIHGTIGGARKFAKSIIDMFDYNIEKIVYWDKETDDEILLEGNTHEEKDNNLKKILKNRKNTIVHFHHRIYSDIFDEVELDSFLENNEIVQIDHSTYRQTEKPIYINQKISYIFPTIRDKKWLEKLTKTKIENFKVFPWFADGKYMLKKKYSERKPILFAGRLDENKFSLINDIDLKLDVYGDGGFKHKLNKNFTYHGKYSGDINELMQNYRYLLTFSKNDGFPFIIIEALRNGCIPIILDTYPAAKYFKLNSGSYLLKKSRRKKCIEILEKKQKHWVKRQKKNETFINEVLKKENFDNEWKEIMNGE